jgi:hypothetical protein
MTRIAHGFCDTCGAVGAVVVLGKIELDFLTQCRSCDPTHFERAARRDIDAWLSGGRANPASF